MQFYWIIQLFFRNSKNFTWLFRTSGIILEDRVAIKDHRCIKASENNIKCDR